MFLGRSLHSSGEPETHYIPQGNGSAGLGVVAYIGRRMRQEDLEFEVSLGYTMIFTLKKISKQKVIVYFSFCFLEIGSYVAGHPHLKLAI